MSDNERPSIGSPAVRTAPRGWGGTPWLLALALLVVAPTPAAGYVGPGAALAMIGAALAFLAAIFMTIGGFVWYPLKRIWKALGGGREGDDEGEG